VVSLQAGGAKQSGPASWDVKDVGRGGLSAPLAFLFHSPLVVQSSL
jgi:hypothetical protein